MCVIGQAKEQLVAGGTKRLFYFVQLCEGGERAHQSVRHSKWVQENRGRRGVWTARTEAEWRARGGWDIRSPGGVHADGTPRPALFKEGDEVVPTTTSLRQWFGLVEGRRGPDQRP